eukprot:scaffold37675_cov27-Tisochrysis_lutea.AAC.3
MPKQGTDGRLSTDAKREDPFMRNFLGGEASSIRSDSPRRSPARASTSSDGAGLALKVPISSSVKSTHSKPAELHGAFTCRLRFPVGPLARLTRHDSRWVGGVRISEVDASTALCLCQRPGLGFGGLFWTLGAQFGLQRRGSL